MKKLLSIICIAGLTSTCWARTLTMDTTDSGAIIVSTAPTSPTQILSYNPNAVRTIIINPSTTTVFLSGMTSTSTSTPFAFSISLTTGSFYIAGSTTTQTNTFSPDGPYDSFTGPLWAVTNGGTGTSIERVRFK